MVVSRAVQRLAPVIPVSHIVAAKYVKAAHSSVKHLLHHVQHRAHAGLAPRLGIGHALRRAHVSVFGILHGRQHVNAAKLYLIQGLVVALRVGLRLYVARKQQLALTVYVHHGITHVRTEKLFHIVGRQQPHRGLLAQQHVKGVAHLALHVHRIVAEPQAALSVAYLQLLAPVAMSQHVHLYMVALLVVKTSVYVHGL